MLQRFTFLRFGSSPSRSAHEFCEYAVRQSNRVRGPKAWLDKPFPITCGVASFALRFILGTVLVFDKGHCTCQKRSLLRTTSRCAGRLKGTPLRRRGGRDGGDCCGDGAASTGGSAASQSNTRATPRANFTEHCYNKARPKGHQPYALVASVELW